jgi:SAM-dependent methyltransferase
LPVKHLLLDVAEILSSADRRKIDSSDDRSFYRSPRMVTHADDQFLSRLTELYASVAEPGDRVFDAMSSWRSFLPAYSFERVVGHGLNEAELEANEQLDEYFLQDFNSDQSLPLGTDSVDLLCCALSVQYLQYPGAVFAEFGRVLDTDGTAVVSFTNRMFPTKAVRAWRTRPMDERAALVERYLAAGGLSRTSRVSEVPGSDPFYAVVGRPSNGE